MDSRGIATLMTDFGHSDAYVGAMKGVMMSVSRKITIVDICHDVPSFHIASASYILWTYYKRFPPGTVHCAVVDPGVGGGRKCVAAKAGGYFFVLPDNGILSLVANENRADLEAREITNPSFMLERVSDTFHGRDIFAPCAALLASGAAFEDVGPELEELDLTAPANPCHARGSVTGSILHIDKFGNYVTNIHASDLERFEGAAVFIKAGPFSIIGLSKTFSDRDAGDLVAYLGSADLLEVGAVKSSAAAILRLNVGDSITVAGMEGGKR